MKDKCVTLLLALLFFPNMIKEQKLDIASSNRKGCIVDIKCVFVAIFVDYRGHYCFQIDKEIKRTQSRICRFKDFIYLCFQ